MDGPGFLDQLKVRLSIYHIGGVLTLEIRFSSRKNSLSKLLVPLPKVWRTRFSRS